VGGGAVRPACAVGSGAVRPASFFAAHKIIITDENFTTIL
jgi:hypothetical protein